MSTPLYSNQNVYRRPVTPPNDETKKVRFEADNDMLSGMETNLPTLMKNQSATNKGLGQTNETQGNDGMQRTDVTRRIENEVSRIIQWENPVRSGAILFLLVGALVMTRSYSLLQICAALMTTAIGMNLIYVTFMMQTQRVFLDRSTTVHPYSGAIENQNQRTIVDRQMVHHYSSLLTDIAETVIRGIARIVFIENATTSAKWLAIFYFTWSVSTYMSCRSIALLFVISAFLFPRLYTSNKGIVDAHIQQGEAIIKNQLQTTQNMASERISRAYARARACVAQFGTSATDAKSALQNSAIIEKRD